jgi:hypothetical protein
VLDVYKKGVEIAKTVLELAKTFEILKITKSFNPNSKFIFLKIRG